MAGQSNTRSPRTRAAAAPEATFEMALAVMVLIALFAAAWISGDLSTANADPMRTERVRVQAGDTLWSLAESHPSPGRSTVETADLLARMNGLESDIIVEGAVLSVPAVPAASGEVAQR